MSCRDILVGDDDRVISLQLPHRVIVRDEQQRPVPVLAPPAIAQVPINPTGITVTRWNG